VKSLAVAAALAAILLVLPAQAGAKPPELAFYWTVAKTRAELAEDGIGARCHGRYERFRAQGEWYYRYFRCASRSVGRFDVIVRGESRYERIPLTDPDPAPRASVRPDTG
jgi:hypothetical protein